MTFCDHCARLFRAVGNVFGGVMERASPRLNGNWWGGAFVPKRCLGRATRNNLSKISWLSFVLTSENKVTPLATVRRGEGELRRLWKRFRIQVQL